jgi:hypothetical protein
MSTMTATQAASAVHPVADMSDTLSARSSTYSTHRFYHGPVTTTELKKFAPASFAGKAQETD